MTFAAHRSSTARHLLLRAAAGDSFPADLVAALVRENVRRGWLRATGILDDVECLPALPAGEADGTAGSRTLPGPVHVLHLDAPLDADVSDAEPVWRCIVAFQGDRGVETQGVQIVRARIRTMEALVTVLEDAVVARTWAAAIEASARPEGPPSAATSPGASLRGGGSAGPPATTGAFAMPPRPVRAAAPDVDAPVPEAGDTVEHFAFGPGDVVKSDGDRLHIRVAKDGRIREIALEMLRVTPLGAPEDPPGTRHFKLERRL
jgi:hypothetical protein